MESAGPMEFELHSDPAVLPEVRDKLRQWATAEGWTEDQINEIVLAVDEALSNVIRHGYGGPCEKRIDLTARMIDDAPDGAGLEITVRDFSEGVSPEQICGRELSDVRPGGLGVHLIKAMMEAVEYERADGGGLRLTMRKSKSHHAKSKHEGNQP